MSSDIQHQWHNEESHEIKTGKNCHYTEEALREA